MPTVIVDQRHWELSAYTGAGIVLKGPKAYPPGAPLIFSITPDGSCSEIHTRAIGSKRISSPDQPALYEVRARFVSLPRTLRAQLEQLFSQ